MSDLALGVIVLTFIAVPVSLLLLALADVIRLDGEGARRRWIRNCLYALAVPAAIPLGIAMWGYAGAAHLEPLCQAYAQAEYRSERPVAATALILEGDSLRADAQPGWARAITTALGAPRGPLNTIAVAPDRDETAAIIAAASDQALRLRVQRLVHHENRWFRVQMDRFSLTQAAEGTTLALADELWIDAGRARYRCGIVSGAIPTADSTYPSGDGVAGFVGRVLAGAGPKPGSRDSAN